MNKRIRKFFAIWLLVAAIIDINICYEKNVFAMSPPAMSVNGKLDSVIMPDNAIIFADCINNSNDIIKIEMIIYEDYKVNEVGRFEKKVDSSLPWINVFFNVQKDMGVELKPGRKYYAHCQAICKNGREQKDYDNGYWFVTPNAHVTTIKQNIVEDNAGVIVNVKGDGSEIVKVGVRVTCFGCIVGTMEREINKQTDDLNINFDLKNEGKMNLLPNCNYQYNAYVVTRSLSGWKNEGRVDTYGSFKTLEGASITKGTNRITKRNVLLRGNLSNPRKKTIEKYGLIIKKGNKVIGQGEKSYPVSEKNATRKQLKFNIRKDMKKIKLVKGKKYKYEIYSFVGGKKYVINGTFKVKKTIVKR